MRRSEWILIWSGIEINTLSFLRIKKTDYLQRNEFEFKYFIIQFIGSTLFLTRSLYNRTFLLFISLRIKLLLVPFVFWILPCLRWIDKSLLINLLTVQKIGPIFITINCLRLSKIMFIILIINIITRLLFIYNKISTTIIIAFSSIIQLSFIIILIKVNIIIFYIFFFIYVVSSIFVMISCFFYSVSLKKALDLFIIRGFPPFFLFFIKLWLIRLITSLNMNFLVIIIIVASIIISYVYIKIVIKNFFIIRFSKINWLTNQPKFWTLFIILGLFLI